MRTYSVQNSYSKIVRIDIVINDDPGIRLQDMRKQYIAIYQGKVIANMTFREHSCEGITNFIDHVVKMIPFPIDTVATDRSFGLSTTVFSNELSRRGLCLRLSNPSFWGRPSCR